MSTKRTKILFDKSGKDWVLSIFKKTTDGEGFIVEKNDTSIRVETPEGRQIHKDELAVIRKGSQKFIAGDLTSLMKLSKDEI